ncbi:amidophosphoribosyltransferase [Candidatus Sulfurimonas marisnigri]|uniref:Amidophosphoribosyltransferase n=1 Tax=Candidatus Sulfurimonas marisnigri TaxID=2740405 RepID=A0A7S7LZQ9_9BACT|nr:amidophosphoribosyltransferase [Candidatus Sulfurimonas marisnigri]QOY54406.1 amidophosphoribosyltransferase [Candidatus Sulfurimonas marisnigri]
MREDINEKCAVVGIFGHKEASKLAYFSLHALQHRGQEAAGISSSDGEKLHTIKKRGLVMRIFDEAKLKTLSGSSAIGHTRYSTAGDDSILDAQPVFARYDLGEMAIVHNGNLTNAEDVRNKLIEKGAIFQTFMDTENLIHLIAKSEKKKLLDRIVDAVGRIEGAFSLVFLSRTKMFAMRDRFGFRPLSLGKLPNGGYIVASETCAFDLVSAEFVRDVEPGELLIFEEGKEIKSIKVFEPTPKHCIFEYVYFARPDSKVFGQSVYQTRKNMGKELAHIKPVEADIVIPVPDGGVPSAIGYAQESGIPYEMGIMRNHYIGRTFIEPTQEMRDLKVKMKLSPMTDIIKGKKVVVVDDSIVRGTTSKRIVRMLKEAGATEVHMRVSSPPTTDPCYYGVDTPNKDKLIAANMTIDEICTFIEADSLAYLDGPALLRSVNTKEDNYCTACFTGEYIV